MTPHDYELANPFAVSSRLRRAVRHGAHPGGLECVEEAARLLVRNGTTDADAALVVRLGAAFQGRKATGWLEIARQAIERLQALGL